MIVSPGGGYGPPLEPDAVLVVEDVREELYSDAVARDVYGVVLDSGGGQVTWTRERSTRIDGDGTIDAGT
jgi:N-methylhydantoinase B/oxoprolinase/acetone carboxylase alpha subunit